MGRKRSYTPLNVFLNARLVGQLVREPSGGVSFAYARDWLEWEHRMPVSLSLPLQENRYSGAPVLAVFDNLLPDSDVIRRRAFRSSSSRATAGSPGRTMFAQSLKRWLQSGHGWSMSFALEQASALAMS